VGWVCCWSDSTPPVFTPLAPHLSSPSLMGKSGLSTTPSLAPSDYHQLSKAQRKFGHQILRWQLSLCHGQLATIPGVGICRPLTSLAANLAKL